MFHVDRRVSLIFFLSILYLSVRVYFEYKSISVVKNPETAIAILEMSNEAFMERLQKIIREEFRSLQTKERIKSEMLISRLANEYKTGTIQPPEQRHTQESDDESEKSQSRHAFSFHVRMNFSRFFDWF